VTHEKNWGLHSLTTDIYRRTTETGYVKILTYQNAKKKLGMSRFGHIFNLKKWELHQDKNMFFFDGIPPATIGNYILKPANLGLLYLILGNQT
jgi:hypothetical protein